MADLKSISNKALKKIIREGKLSALLQSKDGKLYFDSFLKNPVNPQLEFIKYWYKFIQL
jgi:hypothetical protein